MSVEAEARALALTTEPLRIAGPVTGFAAGTAQSLRDIWAHRELLGLLARREIKARYKDSLLGLFWSLMKPLTMLVVYYFAVGKFLKAEIGTPDFAIYIFTGLTAWNLYSEIVSIGTSSVVANGGLVKKVYLPREVFPLSTTGSALFNFAIQFAILCVAVVIAQKPPSLANLLYAPASFLLLVVYGMALTILLSAVNVFFRDIQYLVEVSMIVLFWASPIIYSWTAVADAVGPIVTEIYLANPVTLAVLGFQRAFWVAGADHPLPEYFHLRLGIALAVSFVLLWLCQRIFARLQGNFAQEL